MKPLKKIILVIIVFTLCNLVSAQTNKTSPWTKEGVQAIIEKSNEAQLVNNTSMFTQEGYLIFAEMIVDRLLEINPSQPNYNYRKGFLLLEIYRNYNRAIPYLKRATASTHPDVDMFSAREQRAPADVFFHLGRSYHYAENIDSARYNYEQFLLKSSKKSELIPVVKMRLEQLITAERLIAQKTDIVFRNIGKNVNTKYPDYSSVISFDGSALYFTSRRPWYNGESEAFKDPKIDQYPEDVYVSYLDFDSTWTEPVRLQFCEPNANEATIAVSVDERRIYVYDDSKGGGDLYFSDFKNSKFRELAHLDNSSINTPFWEPHCMVSNDGKFLFFSSDRPGGFGGLDIYYSTKTPEGTWSEPINMGPEINGPYDDDSPFISITNDFLYFATNDARSMGGYDIMIASLIGDKWGNVENMGYPFNRTNDDLYYTTTIDGLQGYLTSYRPEGEGEKDIYEIFNKRRKFRPIIVLHGEIITEDGTPLPENIEFIVDIKCLDCDTKEYDHKIFPRPRDGVFMSTLRPCKMYELTYRDLSDGKIIGQESFLTDCEGEISTIYKNLVLDVKTRDLIRRNEPLVDIEPEVIPEVIVKEWDKFQFMYYFEYNNNKIATQPKKLNVFTKQIEKLLKDGKPNVNIIITSSASKVPTSTYKDNASLSTLRAENLKYDIMMFFRQKNLLDRVNITIEKAEVNGPEYENDFTNSKKYKPYQYVNARTE